MTYTRSLRSELDELHAQYVEQINQAVTAGDDRQVAELAAGYDEAATRLVAQREGKTDLLPLRRTTQPRRSAWRRLLTNRR